MAKGIGSNPGIDPASSAEEALLRCNGADERKMPKPPSSAVNHALNLMVTVPRHKETVDAMA